MACLKLGSFVKISCSLYPVAYDSEWRGDTSMSPVSSHSTGVRTPLDTIKGRQWDEIHSCSVDERSGRGLHCSWDTAPGSSELLALKFFLVSSWNTAEHIHAYLSRENEYLERKFKMKVDVTAQSKFCVFCKLPSL